MKMLFCEKTLERAIRPRHSLRKMASKKAFLQIPPKIAVEDTRYFRLSA